MLFILQLITLTKTAGFNTFASFRPLSPTCTCAEPWRPLCLCPLSPSATNKVSTTSGEHLQEEFQPRNFLCFKNKQNKRDLTTADAFRVRITSFPSVKGISQPEFQLTFVCSVLVHLQSSSARQKRGAGSCCFALNIPEFFHFQAFLPGAVPVQPHWGCACRYPTCVSCEMQVNSSPGGRIQGLVLPSGGVVLAPPSRCLVGTSRLVLGQQRESAQGSASHTMIWVPVPSP